MRGCGYYETNFYCSFRIWSSCAFPSDLDEEEKKEENCKEKFYASWRSSLKIILCFEDKDSKKIYEKKKEIYIKREKIVPQDG